MTARRPPGSVPGAVSGSVPSTVLGAVLWGLFAALLLGGGWLFLRACALDALGLDYCPVRADARDDGDGSAGAMRRAAAEGDALAREVHMAELSAADAPACPPPAPAAVPVAAPIPIPAPMPMPAPAAPAPPPPPAPARPLPRPVPIPTPRAETERIDRKVEERGGRNGRLQFTLEWATLDDLDLNVDCPGGRIDATAGHAGPGICGDGRKDVDANRNLVENLSATPIENVVWQNDIPSGTYRVEVIEYRAKSDDGDAVPFTLRMRWNGQERVCHDVVTALPLAPRRMVNGRVIGGTEKLLTWTFGTPLPDCTFVTSDTVRGGQGK